MNSGAEAVENAVKIARRYTGRPAVVVFDHAFHGRTLLTMTLTAKNTPYKQGFGPFAPEIYRVPMANPYRWPTGPQRCAADGFAQVVDEIDTQIGAENVAAVLVEPIQGEGGVVVPAAGFLPCFRDTAGTAASCSSLTRSRPVSLAPATCSPASTRASCPTSSRPRRASPGVCHSAR